MAAITPRSHLSKFAPILLVLWPLDRQLLDGVLLGDPSDHLPESRVRHQSLDRVVLGRQVLERKASVYGPMTSQTGVHGLRATLALRNHVVPLEVDDGPLAERTDQLSVHASLRLPFLDDARFGYS